MPLAKAGRAARTCLLVTSERGLAESYERPGVDGVLDRLKSLARARSKSGITTFLYVPDAAGAGARRGLPRLTSGLTADGVLGGLRSMEAEVCSGRPADYLLLVGNSRIVPTWTVDNPAADSDKDLPSDAPYGSAEPAGGADAYLVPDRAVARVPLDGEPNAAGDLSSFLDRLLARPSGEPRGEPFGLTAAIWRDQAARIYDLAADAPIRSSPPLGLSSFDPAWLGPRSVLYFNVHGSQEEPYWYGQEGLRYPKVLSPEVVARSRPAASLVVTEACYGGLVECRSPQTSIALAFLAAGAAALVGASAIAYGSPDVRLTEADLAAYLLLKRVLAGERYGDAFRESKIDFAAEMLSRQGYLDGDDKKTLLEFNLFGDPTASLAPVEGGRGQALMIPEDVLESVKRLVAARFPEMEGVDPDLAEESVALDGGLAEKVLKLRPQHAKGDGESVRERRVFVASFARLVISGERRVERIVRITFDERGEVLKIVTSK
ncbi:MAG: C25 family cysteine peptidase [bacterium]